MYQDLWVASDGITTVRFSDEHSARIYCAETDWNWSEIEIVRHAVTISEDGRVVVQDWQPAMHSELGVGTWSEEDVWLPDLSEAALATLDQSLLVAEPYDLRKYAKLARQKNTSVREEAILLENR